MAILHPNFIDDATTYRQVEALWRDRWFALLASIGQESLWQTPWLNTHFVDGTPFQDGNPIFSAVCPTRRLGLRVIQAEPTDGNTQELNVWTDTFAEGDPEMIRELVIECVLTDDTLRDAFEVMKRWVTEPRIWLEAPPMSWNSERGWHCI